MSSRRIIALCTDPVRGADGRGVRRACAGQAMVELAFMIVLLVSMVLAIFEFTVMYYNTSVVTNAVHQASWAASNGAEDRYINNIIYTKLQETLVTAYIVHSFSDPAIKVYNRFCRDYPDVAPYSNDHLYYSPQDPQVAGYVFRAEGYHVNITIDYKVGFSFPFIGYIQTLTIPIVEETRILAHNDADHDGMVDCYEQEYYHGIWSRGVLADTTTVSDSRHLAWRPYSHTDGWRDDINDTDDDDDGWPDDYDSTVWSGGVREWNIIAKYDRNDDGLEDKYDIEWRKHPSRLHP